MIHLSNSQHWLVHIYERGLQELLLDKNSICLDGKGHGISQADASFSSLCGGPFFYRALQYLRPFIPQPPFHLVNLVVNMEAATHSKIYKKRRNSWSSAFKGLQKMDCLHIPKKKWAVVWFWGNLQFKYWTEALLQKKSKLEMLKLLLSLDRSCDLKKDQI